MLKNSPASWEIPQKQSSFYLYPSVVRKHSKCTLEQMSEQTRVQLTILKY